MTLPAGTPTRWHPLSVTLHWLIAVAVLATLIPAMIGLEDVPNDSPDKVMALQIHMALGITVVTLTLIRLIVRFSVKRPPKATEGEKALDWVRKISHFLLYFFIFSMGATGIGMALQADLFAIVYQGADAALPGDFYELGPLREGHGLYASLLLGLIVLHLCAALWHQFVRKDKLFRRMWYGNRW